MPNVTGVSCGAPLATRCNCEVWSEDRDTSRCCHSDYPRRAHLFRLQGYPAGAENEVLYLPTGDDEDLWGNVVLFPGDVQDLRDRMFSAGHGEFSDYCLESTARVLATKFPGHDVWVVLPKNHVHGVLASYDNFVKTDWASGGAVLEYLPDGWACKHLEALLNTAQSRRGRNGATSKPDESLPLTLVGFSKGAVVLNQLVTELAWEATPAALSPRTPNRSKRNDPRGDGDPRETMNNRKRSRVSLNDCEGILTNPPSPAVSWEGGRGGEERDGRDACSEPSQGPHDASGSACRSHQDAAGSLWHRLCNTFGMSRFSKRLFSTSLASGTNGSPARENLDGRGRRGWDDTDTGESKPEEEDLIIPGSPSPRPASTRDNRRRRKRSSVSSTEGQDNARSTEMGGAAQRLFGRVAAVHWVDGGNGGLAGGSFPTNMRSLAKLAAVPNLVIRVHGSPYQWGNNCRPFLAFEADSFLDSVEGFRQALDTPEGELAPANGTDGGDGSGSRDREYLRGAASPVAHEGPNAGGGNGLGRIGTACDVKRMVYFETEQPSLENHFRVLRELNTE